MSYRMESVKGSAVCASIEEAAAWLWKDQGAFASVNGEPIPGDDGWETQADAEAAIREALEMEVE